MRNSNDNNQDTNQESNQSNQNSDMHPMEGFMQLTMENLKKMIDVDTVIGNPLEAPDGSMIIPLSKVKFGFAAGGSEFVGQSDQSQSSDSNQETMIPFGGGSGGGVSITPRAFLIANKDGVEIKTLDEHTRVYEKLLDKGPQLVDQAMEMLKQRNGQKEQSGERNQ